MNQEFLTDILARLQGGKIDLQQAIDALKTLPFEKTASARIDHHRAIRCGCGEVIYCSGKTPDQVQDIFARLAEKGNVLATRATEEMFKKVQNICPSACYERDSLCIIYNKQVVEPTGHVAIVSAGTSDMPVAEEARITAEFMGAKVTCHYDCGVAGLHRLLADMDTIRQANAVVAVAGMEGALASVVGGLVSVPVIAVPTSVGYGASFGGIAALLTMLNSCASGISVVNIDNGFAGGYNAALINRNCK